MNWHKPYPTFSHFQIMFRYIEWPSEVKIEIAFCYFMCLSLCIVLQFNLATLGIFIHHLLKKTRTFIHFFIEVGVLELQNIVHTAVDWHGNLLTETGTFASMIIFWLLCIKLQHCLNWFISEQWFTLKDEVRLSNSCSCF